MDPEALQFLTDFAIAAAVIWRLEARMRRVERKVDRLCPSEPPPPPPAREDTEPVRVGG